MIAAAKDLASSASDVGPNHNAVDFLEACNPLFEQGMLSRRRINNKIALCCPTLKGEWPFLNSGVETMRTQVTTW